MRDQTIIEGFRELQESVNELTKRQEGIVYQTTLNAFRWVALMRVLEQKGICTTAEINTVSQSILEEQQKAADDQAIAEAKANAEQATKDLAGTPTEPTPSIILPNAAPEVVPTIITP